MPLLSLTFKKASVTVFHQLLSHRLSLSAPACEPDINISAIIAARMACPIAFQQLTYQMETAEKTMLNIAVMLEMLRYGLV